MASVLTPSSCYYASSVLFLISAPGHAIMGRTVIEPGLKSLGDSEAAAAAKSNWMVHSASHIVTCVLAHRWSTMSASAWTWHDEAMLITTVAMNWYDSLVYVRKGNKPTSALLISRAALLALGRALQYLKP